MILILTSNIFSNHSYYFIDMQNTYCMTGNFRIHIFTKTNANQAFRKDIYENGKALPFTLPHYKNLFSKNGSEFL